MLIYTVLFNGQIASERIQTVRTSQQTQSLLTRESLRAVYIWLRIALSYCVIGAIITTLVSAYTQEVQLIPITLIMATFVAIGAYKAEVIRRHTGLNDYFDKLVQHKYHDF